MKKEELIIEFNSMKPHNVLEKMQGTKADLEENNKLIELLRKEGMNDGVINVLFSYIQQVSNGRSEEILPLSKKMAAHWLRKNISTVEEAIDFARSEHARYVKLKKQGEIFPSNSLAKNKLQAIESAMKSGLSDEQLGKFVRELMK